MGPVPTPGLHHDVVKACSAHKFRSTNRIGWALVYCTKDSYRERRPRVRAFVLEDRIRVIQVAHQRLVPGSLRDVVKVVKRWPRGKVIDSFPPGWPLRLVFCRCAFARGACWGRCWEHRPQRRGKQQQHPSTCLVEGADSKIWWMVDVPVPVLVNRRAGAERTNDQGSKNYINNGIKCLYIPWPPDPRWQHDL